MFDNLKILVNRLVNPNSSDYTKGELSRAYSYLAQRGYLKSVVYASENNASDNCLVDFVRRDAGNDVVGIVTLHLDKDKKGVVQDGIVEIKKDEDLISRVGRKTSIPEFVRILSPSAVQKLYYR